ncbi:MAG: SDR family oxidoreductase [Candidatus Latescibacteria bacterium]|nr:SDR family oxidoreductase [Candidatus Latescibacterota bacterium]
MGQLERKTAIITGGGTGIGRAIAKRFHNEGATVLICGRRMNMLKETAESIDPNSPRILCVKTDVTDEKEIEHLYKSAMSKSGRIDILVNNAGVMRFGSLAETPLDDWDLMMKTNTWGPWRLMVNVLPYMKKAGGGSIINISSIAGIKSYPGAGIYCASKAAMQVISQVVAMENAGDNIRVNCILPAVVEDTELSNPIFGEENVPAFWDKLRPLHPLGRNGKPDDIAEAALFFATDQSSWITGTLLNVDGGRHMATNRPAD